MNYDVVIVGGGVVGSALLYTLTKYTDIKKIALVEKYDKLATVASNSTQNSQTLHFGDIETNYTLEKAKKVNAAAELVKAYVEHHKQEQLFKKTHKMVLAVGSQEISALKKRHEEFKHLFPKLKIANKKELRTLEPLVMKARQEDVMALVSDDGYTIDYGALSESFVKEAQKTKNATVLLGKQVKHIKKNKDNYTIDLGNIKHTARIVVTCTGGHSLTFAYSLGYGREWILLPVVGNYFCAQNMLKGKVYTMQLKKLPFAAVHGDPDFNDSQTTRFGPTAKVLPMLERRNYHSVIDFFRLFEFRIDAVWAIIKIALDPTILKFIIRNVLFDLPFIGKYFFLKEVRKIIPTAKGSQLRFGKGLGGLRPQIVNVKKRATELGEAKIKGDNIIFNITPSPGASTCLQNAREDANTVAEMFGATFDEKSFLRDHQ